MLPQMITINRFGRAAQILIRTQRGLALANDTEQNATYRLKGHLQNSKTSVKDLVEVYHNLAVETSQSALFSLTEEKLLNLLIEDTSDDEDLVSRFLPRINPYDYNSLCNLFIEIASVGRRPTPLIRAASSVLSKIPYPGESSVRVSTLISTLEALIKLNYINRPLVSKIINDITQMINLKELDQVTQCKLLRSLVGLKWRHEPLMAIYYDYITRYQEDRRVNHNLILTVLYVTAVLNYKPRESIESFYSSYMAGTREDSIAKGTRKWLSYVWSLAVLGIADKHHLESVLNDNFILGIQNPLGSIRFNHGDVMKLLNIRAIACVEKHMTGLKSKLLDEMAEQRIHRGANMDKFSSKIKNALSGLVSSNSLLRTDIHTPYGFVVDCIFRLDQNSEFLPLEDDISLEVEMNSAKEMERNCDELEKKCALIYVSFDEALANYPEEPIAQKQITSRILGYAGYKTIFLHEATLSKEKTSSDLSDRIREIINGVR